MPNATSPTPASSRNRRLLDLRDDGYGFLRTKSYHPSPERRLRLDQQVRRYHCERRFHYLRIPSGRLEREGTPNALLRVDSVAGSIRKWRDCGPRFEDLTPLFPDEKLQPGVERRQDRLTPRIVDLLSADRQRASAD